MASSNKSWPEVLAEIVKLTKENPKLLSQVRELRATQDLNERAWAAARAKIQQDFVKKREANTVIRAVGGSADDALIDAEEKATLRKYDEKLIVAFKQMLAAQQQALIGLGLPMPSDHEDMHKVGQLLDTLLGTDD
ncbi:hypothetical protein BCR37DRAFT_257816 [Protomyces lactucae-debilis]|uniref:Uncharacterized protein n=1 Tax=Protomyces lactucae-debilis TaxID=2754530 RepID=A0A1Y2FPE1_PROLT|nr:uncharacterized protein BCR37DRAFT_257816 [Protomyces lactucae-debilis]ORY85076.1 hypothetical protein BCR37DRAFT_257816 [Protomyces lactucae-debilis]